MRMGFREWLSRLCRVPRQQKDWKTLVYRLYAATVTQSAVPHPSHNHQHAHAMNASDMACKAASHQHRGLMLALPSSPAIHTRCGGLNRSIDDPLRCRNSTTGPLPLGRVRSVSRAVWRYSTSFLEEINNFGTQQRRCH